jgi:hypothetical protein
MSGWPLTLNRSMRRSRVRVMYAVSLDDSLAASGPGPWRAHRGRLFAGACLDHLCQVLDPTLAPQVNLRRGEPAEAQQHVQGADVALLGQGGLGGAELDRAKLP